MSEENTATLKGVHTQAAPETPVDADTDVDDMRDDLDDLTDKVSELQGEVAALKLLMATHVSYSSLLHGFMRFTFIAVHKTAMYKKPCTGRIFSEFHILVTMDMLLQFVENCLRAAFKANTKQSASGFVH